LALSAAVVGCLSTDSSRVAEELRTARREAAVPHADAIPSAAGNPAAGLSGQPRVNGELALRDAINVALERNLALRVAFLRRGEAVGVTEEARGAALPDLGLTGSATSDLKERDDTPETYALGVRLTQPLWRSGIVAAGLRYAQMNEVSTDAAIRQQVQATIASVTRSYLDVLLEQHLVAVYEGAVGVAERLLLTSQSRRKAGTASDYEVLRAEVELSTARADLLLARNTLLTSRMELLRALGVNQRSDLVLTGTLAFVAEDYDSDAAVRAALEHRPDLVQGEASVRMAEANTAVVRGQYGPAVDAFVGGTYANPDPNGPSGDAALDTWGDDWTAGASLTLTLFDGFARRGRLRQAASKREQAEASLRDAEEAARVEVIKALLDLGHSAELYESQRKNIELAREALRMLESGFRMGRNTQVELLDAQSALTAAMGRYHRAIHAHSVARLNVRHVLGLLGPDAMAPVLPSYRLEADPLTRLPPIQANGPAAP
jgi:outer membrane protein TolC